MSVLDLECMGCGRSGHEPGGFNFQSHLRLCPACYDAMGGGVGVIAFSKEIEEAVDVARMTLVRERLAKKFPRNGAASNPLPEPAPQSDKPKCGMGCVDGKLFGRTCPECGGSGQKGEPK